LAIFVFRLIDPRWSRHSVARVQRRGDRPPSCMDIYLVNVGRQGILVFYQWKKWNVSRHLVFWSLRILTGLKDPVWRLIA